MIEKGLRFSGRYLHALAGCFYLFSFGFLKSAHRGLLFSISRHFAPKTAKLPTLLPVLKFSELLPAPPPVRIFEMDYARGNVSLLELAMINQLAAARQPQALFEFGTFDGRTALNMAANSPEGARLYTLDLPPEALGGTEFLLEGREIEMVEKQTSGARFQGRPESQKITQLYGDSARFDFSPYENKMDFIFVDASHAHRYVLSDSLAALRLLRNRRGIIVWHDYGEWDGVSSALHELHEKNPEFSGLKHLEGTTLAVLVLPPEV